MDIPGLGKTQSELAFNPLFAIWTMPFIISQAWMTAWLGTPRRREEVESDRVEGQIPVPTVFQEKKDHELFA